MSLLSRDPTRISTVLNTDKLQTKKLEIHVLKLTQHYTLVKYITTALGHNLRSHYDLRNAKDKNFEFIDPKDSLPSSLGSANDPYSQTHESNQHLPILFLSCPWKKH